MPTGRVGKPAGSSADVRDCRLLAGIQLGHDIRTPSTMSGTQRQAEWGIRTPDPLLTMEVLYRLS
jgi:hypothetical protein